MSVELKNNQFLSYIVVLLSLFILVLFTKDEIMSVQSHIDEKEQLNAQLSVVRAEQEDLQKIALEVEQEDSVTARYSRNEIIDEKEVYLYSEDKIVDYFYNYADNINSWSGQLLISSINISEEKENDLGFLEMSIEVNAQVSDITVMKAFLDYLIAKDSKYQFFIENYYHPLDGREGNFNMKLPLKVFYR